MFLFTNRYFPSNGEKIFLFVTDLKLPEELDKLDQTIQALRAETDIIGDIDSWYPVFAKYHSDHFGQEDGVTVNNLNYTQFSARLTQFLYSPNGARYRSAAGWGQQSSQFEDTGFVGGIATFALQSIDGTPLCQA